MNQDSVNQQGLSTNEARTRLIKYGKNQLIKKQVRSGWQIFFSQLNNWLTWLLFGAGIISYYLGEKIDAYVIIGIISLSVLFGFFQEFKAEKAIQKLTKYISHKTRVLRDGKWEVLDSLFLVPGDFVSFKLGDRIPADIVLHEVEGLSTDEGVLTGESLPVIKDLEKNNKVFMGTFVVEGKGTGEIATTGDKTEFGKIAQSLEKKEPETDFQKQIKRFSRFLSAIILVMVVFVFLVNSFMHKGAFESFLFSIALAVGIAPELLPMIITVALSYGAQEMAKRKVVAKRLIAVENFGNMDTLCTDKTGTLTKGDFVLEAYKDRSNNTNSEVLIRAIVCSEGFAREGKIENQVDKALWEKHAEVNSELRKYKISDLNEFDFKRRTMSVVAEKEGSRWLIVKGAYESMLPLSTMSEVDKKRVTEAAIEAQKKGTRVILVGDKVFDKEKSSCEDEKDLNVVGLVFFSDPLKESAKESVAKFKNLGVRLKIISGDNAEVVEKIAYETGLTGKEEKAFLGMDLEKLSDSEFEKTVFENNLFARVAPDLKEKIISALNKKDHVVGYLGDGVNDAPALRAADVGIAVDTGSEVAKEASDIVLLVKDLSVMSEGIRMGRETFGNIMKYILNTISANFGNMFTVASSSTFLPFIPLLPTQILLNNFLSDVPLLAIPGDYVDQSFVKRPKTWNFELITKFMVYFGLISSIFDLLMILPMYFVFKVPVGMFRTAWFVESSLSEMLITFSIRTYRHFYKSHPSPWLIILSLISALIVAIIPFTSMGHLLFEFSNLPVFVILWIAFVILMYFTVTEIVKREFFKKFSF